MSDDLRFHEDTSCIGSVHFAATAANMEAYRETLYWCTDRFGDPTELPEITAVPERWAYYPYVVVLVRPEDIIEFKLRWV
jgi:hypothetical protein